MGYIQICRFLNVSEIKDGTIPESLGIRYTLPVQCGDTRVYRVVHRLYTNIRHVPARDIDLL
jgi:hypothetical protein